MAERKEWESERLKAAVREKRAELGLKFTRQLRADEARAFVDRGRIPVGALAKSTFVTAAHSDDLPAGATCLICGGQIGGQPGWVVKLNISKLPYRTVCETCWASIGGEKPMEGDEDEIAETPPVATAAKDEDSKGRDPVEAALKTLTAALSAPKAPPVDEAKIIAEAVAQARKAAGDEARGVMRGSIADFIRDGAAPSAGGGADDDAPLPSAKGDGPDAAAAASGWSARATPDAKSAVEKLTKFLSEFSYFRSGVSMRLINTFARAEDKASALRSYCEVSQMEDLPELVEKMKSPEFAEVCGMYDKFSPKPLNKRFAVFYGAPGGGKTYAATCAAETINGDGKCETVPCSPSMDAADMLYAYRLDYKSGKRGYVPTALLKAMLSGRAVVLDEVNLLPMEARMFLQNILDNKDKVSVMGVELPIRDGFFVIGTMNLETGLGASPLPVPLVDRACVVKEYRTTTAQAAVGAGLC